MGNKTRVSFDLEELVECFTDSIKYYSVNKTGAITSDYDGEVLLQGILDD